MHFSWLSYWCERLYRLCKIENERPKIVISRFVIFNEHEFMHLKAEKDIFFFCMCRKQQGWERVDRLCFRAWNANIDK